MISLCTLRRWSNIGPLIPKYRQKVVDKPKTFSRAKAQRRQENQFLF
jgi:hypothetical protein